MFYIMDEDFYIMNEDAYSCTSNFITKYFIYFLLGTIPRTELLSHRVGCICVGCICVLISNFQIFFHNGYTHTPFLNNTGKCWQHMMLYKNSNITLSSMTYVYREKMETNFSNVNRGSMYMMVCKWFSLFSSYFSAFFSFATWYTYYFKTISLCSLQQHI